MHQQITDKSITSQESDPAAAVQPCWLFFQSLTLRLEAVAPLYQITNLQQKRAHISG